MDDVDDVQQAWAREIERRLRNADPDAQDWQTVKARVLARLSAR